MSLPAYAMNTQSFPELYERWLVGSLFQPWAERLLERVRPAPGDRVLDIACGTGIVARLAQAMLGSDGRVVGLDVSPQMLEVARRVAPAVEWREANAAALPAGDGEFSVVLCQQGLQFFPDRPGALAEMRRVLAPDGRLGVSVWRSDEEVPLFRELRRRAERHVGPIADARYQFGDANALEELLRRAGFSDVRVERLTRPLRFENGSMFVRLNAMALIGMSQGAKELDDARRVELASTIAAESAEAIEPYTTGETLSVEVASNIATARA